jgi:hypothetical protein
MIKQAFNMLSRIHSRAAYLKRYGTPNIFSPIRITPSNYFRFMEGPSATVIRGREFILPLDSITGQETQVISFSTVPTSGSFHLTYGVIDTGSIAYNDTSVAIQVALRLIVGLESVTVSGDTTVGFTVVFIGVQTPTLLAAVQNSPALKNVSDVAVTVTIAYGVRVPWSTIIKRGDKIIDTVYGAIAIDEIIEIVDFGGAIMGYRCRTE